METPTTTNPSQLSPPVVNLRNKFPTGDASSNPSQEEMLAEIKQLKDQIISLDRKVNTLETKLIEADAHIAVISQTSTLLRNELDRAEQYSRRSCIIMHGMKADENTNHLKEVKKILQKSAPEVVQSIDKTHPIGPINNEGKQSMIIKFSKHSSVKKIYKNRKTFIQNSSVSLRPSLTKRRSKTLKDINKKLSEEGNMYKKCINFVFADIEGNLKVCFKAKHKGRDIHTFLDEDHLDELIRDFDFAEDTVNDHQLHNEQ